MKHEKFLKLSELALMSSLAISTTVLAPNAQAHGSSHPHWDRWSSESNYTHYLDFSGKEDNNNYNEKVAFYVLRIENQKVVEPSIIQFKNHNNEAVNAILEFSQPNNKIGQVNVDVAGHLSLNLKNPVENGTYVFILKPSPALNQAAKENLGQNIKTNWGQEKIKGVSGHNDNLVLSDIKLMSYTTLQSEVKDLEKEEIKENKEFDNIMNKTKKALEASALMLVGFLAIKKVINKPKNQLSNVRSRYLDNLNQNQANSTNEYKVGTKNNKMN
jgi:hypothetical protein